MPKLEDFIPFIKHFGLQSDKEAIFSDVTITGTLTSNISQTVVTVGYSNADYVVTDYANHSAAIQAALDQINTQGGGKVFIKRGTYDVTTVLTIGSNTTLEGEEAKSTILKKVAGQNSTVINNKSSTSGNSFIQVRNITIDQNGVNQTAGGGISMTYLTDSLFQDCIFNKSYVFNLFIGSTPGTTLTGTATFTNGDATVTGTNTQFTQLSKGSIIKTVGARFARVSSITSDTSLELDRPWGFATEAGVAIKLVPANARNRIINCVFNGTVDDSDNVGLGLLDDSLIQGCTSTSADDGYGFGPDHCNRLKIIGNTCFNNGNSGIGLETCGYCIVEGNICYGNGNGIYLLSGAYRNVVTGNICRDNQTGIHITYQNTSFPTPDENNITTNVSEFNSLHGIRVGGAAKTIIANNRVANNGNNGIVIVTDNSIVPDKTQITGNSCYDNQNTKTQDRGIYVLNGTNTLVANNIASAGDHTTAGIADSGTSTTSANNI